MPTLLEKPQIITHIEKALNYTCFDVKWIPRSAKFVSLGQTAKNTGALQVYELDHGELKTKLDIEKAASFKCGTFGASSLYTRHLATGDFQGRLCIWDLEKPDLPVFHTKAHPNLINCIDGIGGLEIGGGAPEIVTGSRGGSVKVWDPRQSSGPVAVMEEEQEVTVSTDPADPNAVVAHRDCWTVAFGNSFNDVERMVCAGYDNGDVKLFDLRKMATVWETNLKNGVCSAEFDRKDIEMNKLVITTLESKFHVFDMRTFHPEKGFSSLQQSAHEGSTVWLTRHLPQNRDIFATCGGNGALNIYKYSYPMKRMEKLADDTHPVGVMGKVELINNATLAQQPISSFDWSPDKLGLCVFGAFDQAIRVGLVTKLKNYA